MNKIWIGVFFLLAMPFSFACSDGEQSFDGKCYPCEGYLEFNTGNRVLSCIECVDGFKYQDGRCAVDNPIYHTNSINGYIDKSAMNTASVFKTDDIVVGYAVMIVLVLFIIYNIKEAFNDA